MKIIFLDIDGPMIPYRAMLMDGQPRIMQLFDPCAVGMLNDLCNTHDLKIVLHSAWVRIYGGQATLNHCIEQGLKAEHFAPEPYVDEHIYDRYTRVADYLARHPEIERYVMVDDEPYTPAPAGCLTHPEGMSDRLLLVNYYIGFMFSTYLDIIRMMRDDGEG